MFKTIDSKDIDLVQEFVRVELTDFLQTASLKLPYGTTAQDAFGKIFGSNPSRFKFLPGEKKMISIMVDHANSISIEQKCVTEAMQPLENSIKQPEYINNDVQRSIFLLNNLLTVAKSNLYRPKGGFRYDETTKMISTYLRMICGRLGYETIHRNLEGTLPSVVSTNRYIKVSKCRIVEGELRSAELLKYLKDRDLPLAIALSEDATRIVGRIQYDSISNQIVGFVLPIDKKTGMPLTGAYPARNAEEILQIFSKGHSISSFIIAIMAQPLVDVPPFCLAMFGSDSKYSSEDVEKRWKHITNELAKLNIKVLAISSDSDPKYNRAMRKQSTLGFVPMSSDLKWFSCNFINMSEPFYVQDSIHIGTKLRNFLLRFLNKKIPFGPKYSIEIEHLYILLNTISKDQHLMTATTLNPSDRQNFSSVLRMCSENVIALLKSEIQNSQATVIFLQLMRDVLDSFMDTSLAPLVRVSKIWYCVFILRIWKKFIKTHKKYTLKESFLSSNCYSCIELNAHSLVLCLLYLKENNLPNWFVPHLYSSQACEATFRQLRSFSSTFSTVSNCSVKEALSRVTQIQLQSEIVHSNASNFVFPRNNQQKDGSIQQLPTKNEIINVITKSKTDAIRTAKQMGFKVINDSMSCDLLAPDHISGKQKMKNKKQTKMEIEKIIIDCKKKLTLSDLRKVNLINYAGKHPEPDEKSPFVKLDVNKVVKKSSLCWFLRNDYQKISSDRNRRVMTLTENEYVNKKQKLTIKCPIYGYKSKHRHN